MGGRGSSSGGGGGNTAGLNPGSIISTTSMISAREGKQAEVDQALSVLRDVQDRYGVNVEDAQIASMRGIMSNMVMAYYDSEGNLAINKTYFDAQKMDDAYDRCVQGGFHPSRGNKTGIEATTAHEMGHRLADVIDKRNGKDTFGEASSASIVRSAANMLGISTGALQSQISGYAKESFSECVAEAFSDVFCNGNNASRASRTVVNEINRAFGIRS